MHDAKLLEASRTLTICMSNGHSRCTDEDTSGTPVSDNQAVVPKKRGFTA